MLKHTFPINKVFYLYLSAIYVSGPWWEALYKYEDTKKRAVMRTRAIVSFDRELVRLDKEIRNV